MVDHVGDDEKVQTGVDGIMQKLLDWFEATISEN
jgi:hypothetical protein